MEYSSGRLNAGDFSMVKRKWSTSALIADPLMHIGAFLAVCLIVLGGFHIPDLFQSTLNFWLTFAGFTALFLFGLHILGTVFPNHYIKGKRLRYDGVFAGTFFYFAGTSGAFFVFTSALPAFSWGMWAVFYILYWMNTLGITAGYHRLPTHRTFKCGRNFMRILMGCGATARQNDADQWGRNHLIHHARTEIAAQDPHTPRESFFHAHIGWIWYSYIYPSFIWDSPEFSRGLKDDPQVQEQKKYYTPVMISGFVLPAVLFGLIGLWSESGFSLIHGLGEAAKAFLLCGTLRFVLSYHVTLSVNSWSHKWGPKPFFNVNKEGRDTTGDSTDPWYLAFFSSGENLQNIHHLMDFIACYWVDRWHPDCTGAVLVALERIGRFRFMKWAGLPYDLQTLSNNPNRLKFLLQHTVDNYKKLTPVIHVP